MEMQPSTKEDSSHQQTGLSFKEETSKVLHSQHSCVVLKWEHFGNEIRNTWKVLKMWCWRRMDNISCTHNLRNEEVLQTVKEHPAYSKMREG
jgi:hypothetical protein